MPSVILHVDMDAFFASVEQREDPSIRGLPVIVGADPKGGRGRGVVAACSYEARRYGIHSAQPISQAYRLCPEGVYRPPQGRLYAQISAAIMKILRGFSDRVEPISIDEAFVDATGSQRLFGSPIQIALRIKHQIQQDQQLSASIGVASNKFLAKIASDPGETRRPGHGYTREGGGFSARFAGAADVGSRAQDRSSPAATRDQDDWRRRPAFRRVYGIAASAATESTCGDSPRDRTIAM